MSTQTENCVNVFRFAGVVQKNKPEKQETLVVNMTARNLRVAREPIFSTNGERIAANIPPIP